MIINMNKKTVISKKPLYAVNFFVRGRGMIWRTFGEFDSMVFRGCSSIHMLFMRMPLDIIYLDNDNKICKLSEGLKPWCFFDGSRVARAVIELPVGVIKLAKCEIGDYCDLDAVWCDDLELQYSES